MKYLFVACLLCLSVLSAVAKVPAMNKIRLTNNWEYLKGDLGGIWEAVRPAAPGSSEAVPIWQPVTLPHCFNAEDAVDPDVNYYEGPGWYKTLLAIDNPYRNGGSYSISTGRDRRRMSMSIRLMSVAMLAVMTVGMSILRMR